MNRKKVKCLQQKQHKVSVKLLSPAHAVTSQVSSFLPKVPRSLGCHAHPHESAITFHLFAHPITPVLRGSCFRVLPDPIFLFPKGVRKPRTRKVVQFHSHILPTCPVFWRLL